MAKRLSAEATAIIDAIEKASGLAKSTADGVALQLVTHTKSDDEKFAALTKLVESIALDVKSLLDSRSYARGAWWGMASLAGVVAAFVSWIVAVWKHS